MEEHKLYILQSGEYCKIGVTNGDIEKRIKSLQTGNPLKINLVGIFICRNREHAFDLESSIHKFLKGRRSAGGKEWFCVSVEELKYHLKYFDFFV